MLADARAELQRFSRDGMIDEIVVSRAQIVR